MTALTFEGTKKIVQTKDYRIQVNDAGDGHPIIMIHGTGPGATGWSNFAPNIEELSRRYRCIAVTMPGWGESSPQSLETGRDQAKAIVQLMDTMEIDRAAFIGNSMGGGIAYVLATKHRERVTHVVTMGAGVWGAPISAPTGMSEGIRALIKAYEDPTPANFKDVVQVMCHNPDFGSDELASERAEAAQAFPEHNKNWLDLFRAGVGYEDFLEAASALPHTTVPTLLVHGRDDRTVHFETSLRALALIPNSRLVLINRCGHWAQLEHAEEFNRLVHDFIANN